jgi:hypothetical protein
MSSQSMGRYALGDEPKVFSLDEITFRPSAGQRERLGRFHHADLGTPAVDLR